MTTRTPLPVRDRSDKAIAARLSALGRIEAPAGLRAGVLQQLDLADRYFRFETVAGDVFIAYNRRGISFVERVADTSGFDEDFRRHFGRPAFQAASPPAQLARRIESTLSGRAHTVPRFDLTGLTEFERSVLLKAVEIPFGQVRPYTWIAREIGHPNAQRAVGSALAGNPIPLLIPCHRVVRSDGIIGNYGMGGPTVKRMILEFEGADTGRLEQLGRAGLRFLGSDTTHVFCFPTCAHARRVTRRHETLFASVDQARAAGYRGCKVCRPDAEYRES
jgi:O-6-methylguanine DNA methyltransferase